MIGLPVVRVLARYWRHHPLQVVLTLLGIGLGVAVATGIRLANEGALRAFADGIAATAGRATHRVYAPDGGPVADRMAAKLFRLPAVRALAPVLEARARLGAPDGEPLTVLGIDLVSAGPMLGLGPASEGEPTGGGGPPSDAALGWRHFEQFLAEPGTALSSSDLGVEAGATLTLWWGGESIALRSLGAFSPPEGRAAVFSRTVLVDPATFQERFGRPGEVQAFYLIVAPEGGQAVAAALPPRLRLEPIGAQSERARTIVAAFQTNLEALGLFTLLVAVFLIFNAASFAVVQRKPLVAVLRCVGAPAGAVFRALLIEAALAGLIGGLLGVLAGQWLAELMVQGTRDTVYELFLGQRPAVVGPALAPAAWDTGLLLGVGAALAGAAWPAWEGARVPPVAALRGEAAPTARGAALPALLGLVAIVAGAVLALPARGPLVSGIVAATLLALGCALLTPLALRGLGAGAAAALSRVRLPAARLGARNVARASGRAGVAAASLMIALALWLAIAIDVDSFRQTLELWMDQAVRAEIFLEAPRGEGSRGLSAAFLAAMSRAPWVSDMGVTRLRRVQFAGRPVLLLGFDFDAFSRHAHLPMNRDDQEAVYREVGDGAALVSETLAYPLRLDTGDRIALPTPTGPREVRIAAVVQNYANPSGAVYLHERTLEALYGPQPVRSLALWPRAGMSADAVARAVAAMPGGESVRVTPNRELRRTALEILERTFAITGSMRGVAALVAFVAVVSALMALVSERRRLLGALRATGMTVRSLAVAIAVEAGLLALAASLMAWAVGLAMAVVLIFVINRRAFGWTLQFNPAEGPYLALLGVALGAALLGSLAPILRAARWSVTAAIREE